MTAVRAGVAADVQHLRAGMGGVDRRAAFALGYAALALALNEYFFSFGALRHHSWLRGTDGEDLAVGLAWVAARVVLWLVIPGLVVRLWHREPLATIGWDPRGVARHLRVYGLLYVLVAPCILFAAGRPDFLTTYPFLASARSDLATFVLWELAYVVSFLALESFFRGYLLFTCEKRMGWLAIFVMVVPYTMIHFHKPWPEAMAAIGAGVTLGALALTYRSFWGGVILHGLVAVTMDVLAVRSAGLFGT